MKQLLSLKNLSCGLSIQSRQFQQQLLTVNNGRRINIYNQTRYSFSSSSQTGNKQVEEDAQTKQQSQDQVKSEQSSDASSEGKVKSKYQMELEKRYPKERIEEVQKKLKSQKINLYDYLLLVNNQTKNNYLYTSDVLLSNKIEYKYLKDDPKQILFILSLWSGVGYLSTFLNQYLALLPMILGLGGIVSYMAGRKLVQKTIERIEFVPNEIEKVKIYLVKGSEPILCRIDQIEVIDVNEKAEHPYISDKVFNDAKNMIDIQKDISITLNVEDLTGTTFNALNLVIFGSKTLTQVSNYNLLKTVLEGDIIELNKFKVNKKDTVSDEFINNMLASQNAQKVIEQQKQSDKNIEEIESQIQQEISRFSKKKN